MNRLSIYDAKARFSEVIEQAREGTSTEITKHGRVVARIVPASAPEWDRSAVLGEADKLLKTLKVTKRVNLADLIADERI
jgi:prevent-host-death family protein